MNEEIKSNDLYQENKEKPKQGSKSSSSSDSDSDGSSSSSSETSSYSSKGGKAKKVLKGTIKMGDRNIELGELSDEDLEGLCGPD